MFTISLGDVWRGVVMAVLAPVSVAILGVIGAVITAPNFDAFTVNYMLLFHNLTNAFIIAAYSGFSGYILKNFLTDDEQNFVGIKTKS